MNGTKEFNKAETKFHSLKHCERDHEGASTARKSKKWKNTGDLLSKLFNKAFLSITEIIGGEGLFLFLILILNYFKIIF